MGKGIIDATPQIILMEYSYIIEGQRAVRGEIPVGGSEELAIVTIITSILVQGPLTIKNVPMTGKVRDLLDTLRFLGSDVQMSGTQAVIDSTALTTKVVPPEQTHDSVYEAILLGVLGVTSGRAAVRFSTLKDREELSLHLLLLDELFSKKIGMTDGYSTVEGTLVGDSYTLPEKLPSLTIHALLLGLLGNGTFTLRNIARTVTVDALIQLLTELGAQIEVEHDQLRITRVQRLSPGTVQLPSDLYEVAFWTALSLLTGGEVTLEQVSPRQLAPFLSKIEQLHARYKLEQDTLHVWQEEQLLLPLEIYVQRGKGVDDRLARIFASIATAVQGQSRIVEQELHTIIWDQTFLQMLGIEGTSVHGADGSELTVFGPTNIVGSKIEVASPQLIESALLLALSAEGVTTLQTPIDIFQLYHDFEMKLANAGMIVHTV